jgi:hypothetical protein
MGWHHQGGIQEGLAQAQRVCQCYEGGGCALLIVCYTGKREDLICFFV